METQKANKNKTSEGFDGTMSGYGFTAAGTSYDDEDRLTGYATCGMGVPPMIKNLTHELLSAGGQSLETDLKGMSTVLSSSLTPQALSLMPVARTGTGGSVVYVQHDQQTIADYPVGGVASTPTNRYVYASYIDEPVVRKAAGTSGTIHYYHRNQQYSITAMTTSTGAVAERYAYTAYGQPTILNASGTVLTSSAVSNRYTYTGREWDETLGLHHFRARWMSPLAGRFLGRDPIGYHDGMSTYSCYFDLAGMDPTGLKMLDCTITKDSLKISLFNQNERDQLNGKIPSLDWLANALGRVRKHVPLPELDLQIDVSWQTKACLEECSCDRFEMYFEEDYKFQFKLAMKGGKIPFPQVPGTWFVVSGDVHVDQIHRRIRGGCNNASRKLNCTQAGGKFEVSYCGGVPSVLQGCIKFSIECNGGGCYTIGSPSENTSGCKAKLSAEGCVAGVFCRNTEIFSGKLI